MWEGLALKGQHFWNRLSKMKTTLSFVKTGVINGKGQGFNLDNTGLEMNQRSMAAFRSQALLCNHVHMVKMWSSCCLKFGQCQGSQLPSSSPGDCDHNWQNLALWLSASALWLRVESGNAELSFLAGFGKRAVSRLSCYNKTVKPSFLVGYWR